MKKYFSYIDTALRTIYINADLKTEASPELVNEFLDLAQYNHKLKGKLIKDQLLDVHLQDWEYLQVDFHEKLHYWQTFFYRFLYVVSLAEFRTIQAMYTSFKSLTIELPVGKFSVDDETITNLLYQTYPVNYSVDERSILQIQKTIIRNEESFSLVDLIENATSIQQFNFYQSITSQPLGGIAYKKWIKDPENKCYKNLFYFLSDAYGDEFAYYYIPVCVQLAFHTSEPLSAFQHLINFAYLQFGNEDVNSERIIEAYPILETFLGSQFEPPGSIDDFISEISISKLPVCYLSHELVEKLILAHPLYPIYNSGLQFLELAQKQGDILLNFACKQNKELYQILASNIPIAAISYNFVQLKATNNSIIFDQELQSKYPFPDHTEYTFVQFILDQIKIKDTIMSLLSEAFTQYKEYIPRTCQLSECPYHKSGICWKWKFIPEVDYKECRFPNFFGSFFHKKIDVEQNLLIPLTSEEIEACTQQFLLQHNAAVKRSRQMQVSKLSKKDRNENIFIVTFNKSNHTIEYFLEALDIIKTKYEEASLQGKILLDFDLEDERQWADIPLIVDFVQALREKVPHYLYYLNTYDKKGETQILDFVRIVGGVKTNKGIVIDPEKMLNFLHTDIREMANYLVSNHSSVDHVDDVLNILKKNITRES